MWPLGGTDMDEILLEVSLILALILLNGFFLIPRSSATPMAD